VRMPISGGIAIRCCTDCQKYFPVRACLPAASFTAGLSSCLTTGSGVPLDVTSTGHNSPSPGNGSQTSLKTTTSSAKLPPPESATSERRDGHRRSAFFASSYGRGLSRSRSSQSAQPLHGLSASGTSCGVSAMMDETPNSQAVAAHGAIHSGVFMATTRLPAACPINQSSSSLARISISCSGVPCADHRFRCMASGVRS
jgi:hypothetical protein